MAQPPNGHPEVDWSNWSPPKEGDVRSPCPALNALANHNILPHDAKNITKAMAVKVLTSPSFVHLAPHFASLLAIAGVAANPDHPSHSFDLDHVDKHGWIEHDVSLSRNDIALGSNSDFDPERWKKMVKMYGEDGNNEVSLERASKARYARVKEAKEEHVKAGKPFEYGIKEAVLSYGETAFLMNVFGKDGVVPLEYLRVFFEEERFPNAEGWRAPEEATGQVVMNKTLFKLIAANEHKGEEAVDIGLGTIKAMEAAIGSLLKMPSLCSVM